ncbi:Zn(2)-C6 fungal-type domain-containing protein [Mycena venus]|uniref:Zn(2)-C6 fungal-type domain-containing protein n=1 Tax=Mycena venus TaxID=2733690 RepID=A0A8H7CGS1_9AGAR|nr:Zn(2)-C6 fungal-type domain-containing protein [Mycena venus]
MSEEERSQNPAPHKRKGHRPCDMCRQKKRRCDGEEPCAHCVKHDFSCTYQQRAIQRKTITAASYVHSLENRLKIVEGLLQDSNIIHTHTTSESTPPDVQGPGVQLVAETFQALSLNNSSNHGFQGKSSQAMLVKAAVDLRSRSASSVPLPTPIAPPSKPWNIKPWEDLPPPHDYSFPPEDLMISLISLYFSNVNVYFPLLHRPTFETAVANNVQLSDEGFARTLLLICALGSRYSDDERVHFTEKPFRTAGWPWFDQVKFTLYGQPTLYDLQAYCLAVQFLERASGPRACWTLVGFGVRLAQDIAAHRGKPRTRTITVEEELEKRAYWIMVLLDTQLSAALGRSIAIQTHDFDLDMPVRCDDEYWKSSPQNTAFCQPKNKPASLIDFFTCQLKLNRILSFALKVLYATNRIKSMIGLNDDTWEERTVVEFDAALSTWLNSVPEHLRWDPVRANNVFFDQSAALYCNYYLTQILIHRPFIPASFPSLTICNNAARALSHVAEVHHRRRPNNPLVFGHVGCTLIIALSKPTSDSQTAIFTAGIVLLLNIWGGNRGGSLQDTDLSDVHRCMGVLRAYAEHWSSAGPLLDTLEQLLNVDHVRASERRNEPSLLATPDSGSGARLSFRRSSQSNDFGVPSPQSVFAWPAYEPTLEIADDAYDMQNYTFGPGEAPAHAPHINIITEAEATSNTGSSLNSVSFQDTVALPPPPTNSAQHQLGGKTPDMHLDTVAFWSAAPNGFEVSDWDLYLSSIGHHDGGT